MREYECVYSPICAGMCENVYKYLSLVLDNCSVICNVQLVLCYNRVSTMSTTVDIKGRSWPIFFADFQLNFRDSLITATVVIAVAKVKSHVFESKIWKTAICSFNFWRHLGRFLSNRDKMTRLNQIFCLHSLRSGLKWGVKKSKLRLGRVSST